MLLKQGMEHLALLVQQIEELDRQIEEKIQSEGWKVPYTNLQSIPGVKETGASEILAEVGPQATVFPSAAHLSSWGGVCPGNDESAGKRHSGRTTKGNPYFRATLNQSAWASSRRKESEFEARYQHLQPKLKHKGANRWVAHALAHAIYNVLSFGRPYQPPRIEGLDAQQTRRLIRHHTKRLKKFQVWLPKAPKVSDGAKALRRAASSTAAVTN